MRARQSHQIAGVFLGVVLVATMIAAETVAAFVPGLDVPNSFSNGQPANSQGSALSVAALSPGQSATLRAAYTFASPVQNAQSVAGLASAPTSIRYMWQQWRHDQSNDWFYLYARNDNGAEAASISGAPRWSFYYYTRARGSTLLASPGVGGAAYAGNASSSPNGLLAATIYLDAAGHVPAMLVRELSASGPSVELAGSCSPQCPSAFAATLEWGRGQPGFRSGTVSVLQAVESFPLGGSGTQAVVYDAWEPPLGTSTRITLSNAPPGRPEVDQAAVTGARQSGVTYTVAQAVVDPDADQGQQSLVWVAEGGPGTGAWFEVGLIPHPSGSQAVGSSTPGTLLYRSWTEAPRYAPTGSGVAGGPITGTYVSGLTGSITGLGGGAMTVTYGIAYSPAARGSWTVFARSEDLHGGTTGNIRVSGPGSLTVQ